MSVTNAHIFDEIKELRLEMKADMKELSHDVKANTAFRNNLSGKIAIGVLAIGSFISVVTAIITTFINDKLLGK